MDTKKQSRSDKNTEATARDLYENVRELNYATAHPPGLTLPGTVYTILGNLAAAAHALDQTLQQLHQFLGRELEAGHLGHDRGRDAALYIFQAQEALADAATSTQGLGQALSEAQNAISAINGEPELNAARLAAEDRPLSISEALSMNRQAHPSGPPTPTHPVRPVKEA